MKRMFVILVCLHAGMVRADVEAGTGAHEAFEATTDRPSHAYEMAIVRAVEGMRAMAAKNPECWFSPPENPRKVVSWISSPPTTYTVRYREAQGKQPIYEYEDYEVLVPGTTGQLVKQTQRRITGIKGYREITHLVQDPKGPIERTHTHVQRTPVYEEGTSPIWRWGELGANALALYALRAAGVPETDGLLAPTADGLANFVRDFDMPDGTWDLAWMTAAFAVLPGKTFEELTERCASKLMDGQIASGECAGLWGPVCVNPAVLSPVCKVVLGLSDEKAKIDATVKSELQSAVKGGKGSKKISKAEEEQIRLEQVLVKVQRESARVSQVGLRLFAAMAGAISLEAPNGSQVRIQGHPYLIHNQALADMDSTAVALFALRVAAHHNRLPQKTWRPTLEAAGRTAAARVGIPPPRAAADGVRLALQAVTGARLPDRRWHEGNKQQAVGDFAWFKSVPQVKGRLPAMDSPASAVSTLRALAALNSASYLTRMAPVPVPYDNADFMKIHDEALTLTSPVNGEAEARANTERLFAAGLLAGAVPGATREPPADGWVQTAKNVLAMQNKESGLWGHKTRYILWLSSGIWARKAVLPVLNDVQMGEYYPQAHLAPVLTQPFKDAHIHRLAHAIPEWTVNTAAALLFLAEGVGADWSCPTDGVVYASPEAP